MLLRNPVRGGRPSAQTARQARDLQGGPKLYIDCVLARRYHEDDRKHTGATITMQPADRYDRRIAIRQGSSVYVGRITEDLRVVCA